MTALTSDQVAECSQPPARSQLSQGGESSCQSTERKRASGWILSGIVTYSSGHEVEDIKVACVGVFLSGTLITIRENVAEKRQS